jgi:hypothetical protein
MRENENGELIILSSINEENVAKALVTSLLKKSTYELCRNGYMSFFTCENKNTRGNIGFNVFFPDKEYGTKAYGISVELSVDRAISLPEQAGKKC